MNSVNHVLLASHGTEGALAAEQMVFKLVQKGAKLHHLIVVPKLWQGMTGDDWLNNGTTRDTFRRYLEGQLGKEIDDHCERLSREAVQHGISYTREIAVGEPEECLVEASKKDSFDLVVMGSPRPKGKKGLRSRMKTEPLVKALTIPLLIVPYPYD